MSDECLICGAPLVYLNEGKEMECAICHKKQISSAQCERGHFVCDECHTKGVDVILKICLESNSKDPIHIIRQMMDEPFWLGCS